MSSKLSLPTIGFALLAITLVIRPHAFAAPKPNRPNILLIYSDDQRADTIGAWGNPHIQTPTLDALVERGMSFQANYCYGSDSGAVCVPSRAMLHSGKSWLHVKHDMSNATLLGELLGQHGYTTFGTGKWHNGKKSFTRSFQHGQLIFFGGMCDHTQVPVEDLQKGQFINPRTGEKFSSELFADAAINFLNQHDADSPFFCYLAFTAPHDPRQPPHEFRDAYYQNRPPLPPNFLPQHPFNNGHLILRDENLAPWPRTPDVIRDQLAEYYGAITHMDQQLNRVLQALEQNNLSDTTYIIFASDHGLALGSHGLLGKQSVYEHSMRSPLIIAGPNIPHGKSTRAMTYLLDIFPTICDLTTITPHEPVDGNSLLPLWTGEADHLRDYIFLPFQRQMRAIRQDQWKLIDYPEIGMTQLFDLKHDPQEMDNLAEDPRHQERVARMRLALETAREDAGDTAPLSLKKDLPKTIDLTGHPRQPDRWQPAWIIEKYFQK